MIEQKNEQTNKRANDFTNERMNDQSNKQTIKVIKDCKKLKKILCVIDLSGKLGPIFKVPCRNYFHFWHCCVFCTRTVGKTQIPWIIIITVMMHLVA
jgi:hypothetical protein